MPHLPRGRRPDSRRRCLHCWLRPVPQTAHVLEGRPIPWWPGLWFALASLTRPHGPLFLAVAVAFVVVTEGRDGRSALRACAVLLLPTLLLSGSHLLWRYRNHRRLAFERGNGEDAGRPRLPA